jgi:lysophospholipase L1-like esterase
MFRKLTLTFAIAAVSCVVAAPAAEAGGKAYVAFGDSYASGPGLDNSGNSCSRATNNYPSVIAAHYGLGATATGNWVDYTCASATSGDAGAGSNWGGLKNQVGWASADLKPVDTKAVTITIGGNDAWGTKGTLWDAIVACSQPTGDCSTAPNRLLPSDLDATVYKNNILPAITAIRSATATATTPSKSTKILLASYPGVVPHTGSCGNGATWQFDTNEVTYLDSLLSKMLTVEQSAAAALNTTNAPVVSVDLYTPSFQGIAAPYHSLCQSSSTLRWVDNPQFGFYNGSWGAGPGSGHPTAIGMSNFATYLEAASGL